MLRSIEEFGIPEAAKEALVFAVIGFLTPERPPGHGALLHRGPPGYGARLDNPGFDRDPRPARADTGRAAASRGAHAARLEMSGGPTEMGEARQRNEPLLSFRDVRIGMRHRGHSSEIVRGVDLDVSPGEKLGIVGESGSGKTLTVLSVLRLLPDPPIRLLGGTITFAGQDLGALDEKGLREGARGRDSDGLPGPDDLAEPVAAREDTDRRDLARPRLSRARRHASGAVRCSGRWGCPTRHGWSGPSPTSCPGACCSGS